MNNRNCRLVFLYCVFSAVVSGCGEQGGDQNRTAVTSGPLQLLTEDAFDVEIGEIAELVLSARNVGNETLHIGQITGGCDCGQATLVPDVLEPGDEATLQIEYNSWGKSPGTDLLTFTFETTSGELIPFEDIVEISLHRNVVLDTRTVDMGTVNPGESTVRRVDFMVDGNCVAEDISVEESTPELEVEINNRSIANEPEGPELFSMGVTLVPNENREGFIEEHADLVLRNFRGRDRRMRVRVMAKLRDFVTINPNRVFLGVIRPSEKRELEFELVSAFEGQGEISVDSIKGPEWVRTTTSSQSQSPASTSVLVALEIGEPSEQAGSLTLHIKGTLGLKPFEFSIPCIYVVAPIS